MVTTNVQADQLVAVLWFCALLGWIFCFRFLWRYALIICCLRIFLPLLFAQFLRTCFPFVSLVDEAAGVRFSVSGSVV